MASAFLIGFWVASSIFVGAAGLLQIFKSNLPQWFQDALLYGKVRGNRKEYTVIRYIEVPKRLFSHFYFVGILANGYLLYTSVYGYIYGKNPPHWFTLFLEKSVISSDQVNTEAASAIIVIGLMLLQVTRRFFECCFVSVYSKATMNVVHYILGICFYGLFGLGVLSEAPGLTSYRVSDLAVEFHKPRHYLGLMLFALASYHHYAAHEIFASLRKDKTGHVSTLQHKIPHGDWFKYVSCPHYFAEILIYIAFQIIVGFSHTTILSQVIFVIVNQMVAGYLSHMWYLETFKDYPKERKAVIPFLV